MNQWNNPVLSALYRRNLSYTTLGSHKCFLINYIFGACELQRLILPALRASVRETNAIWCEWIAYPGAIISVKSAFLHMTEQRVCDVKQSSVHHEGHMITQSTTLVSLHTACFLTSLAREETAFMAISYILIHKITSNNGRDTGPESEIINK